MKAFWFTEGKNRNPCFPDFLRLQKTKLKTKGDRKSVYIWPKQLFLARFWPNIDINSSI